LYKIVIALYNTYLYNPPSPYSMYGNSLDKLRHPRSWVAPWWSLSRLLPHVLTNCQPPSSLPSIT